MAESGVMRDNTEQRLYVVMYHYTRDIAHSRYPRIRGLETELFRRQLDFFASRFQPVTMEEVMRASAGNGRLPENALLLTFDDGYIDNYTTAFPMLQERGMQGSFFIPGKTFEEHLLLDVNKIHYILAAADVQELLSDVLGQMDHYRGREFDYPQNDELYAAYAVGNRFDTGEVIFIKRMLQTALPERLRNIICSNLFEKYVGITEQQLAYELYMTRDQIRHMKRSGMFIGIHGYDHYWLGNLPYEQMKEDISKALSVMDEFIDRRQWVMNYPYGNYNDDVLDFIRRKGACIGFTTRVGIACLEQKSLLELPRLDCNDFPPKSENYLEIGE